MKSLNILGIRGFPAAHGGFESFVGKFAPFLRDQGWSVTVYCQEDEGVSSPRTWTDEWDGIRRVHFETRTRGSLATMEFDLRSTLHVLRQPGVDLVLGYNTAIFLLLQRLAGRHVVMNMDGVEWKRQKWGKFVKVWFWLNEWIGAKLASTAIADHPKIAEHLAARGCGGATIIPYGAPDVAEAAVEPVLALGLQPQGYFISIARIEPENSILEMVRAFSRAGTGHKLVVLGKLDPGANPYHAAVQQAAGADVLFPGGIYDLSVVEALRVHCLAYLHGHQVGGTNPSLVEALGCGSPVIAHDNPYNRWTAGEGQLFFADEAACAEAMKALAKDPARRSASSVSARARHREAFTYPVVHEAYRRILEGMPASVSLELKERWS